MFDYQKLLLAYIQLIKAYEGTDYLSKGMIGGLDVDEKLTPEERAELQRLADMA